MPIQQIPVACRAPRYCLSLAFGVVGLALSAMAVAGNPAGTKPARVDRVRATNPAVVTNVGPLIARQGNEALRQMRQQWHAEIVDRTLPHWPVEREPTQTADNGVTALAASPVLQLSTGEIRR